MLTTPPETRNPIAAPGDMPKRIREFCQRTGQPVPESKGQVLRVATESLALKYRVTLEAFRKLSGKDFGRLSVGGGGIQNTSLVQATADACGVEILAGPVEATSCGNLIVQMISTGHLENLAAGRKVIRDSFEFARYSPRDTAAWDEAAGRFEKLL